MFCRDAAVGASRSARFEAGGRIHPGDFLDALPFPYLE